jgi:uncharacterized lipoprotein YajG
MHFKNLVAPVAMMLAFTLSACSNTVSDLTYTPQVAVQPAAVPAIASVTAIDQRKEDPTRLATIMGGFGNPLKTLDTAKPVKDEIAAAFTSGLKARGLLAPGAQAPYRIELVVRKFDADMLIGRTARIDLSLSVLDSSGRAVYQDSASGSESETKFFETGVFADIADLQKLCEIVLNRTVDRMLDNSSFRAAVQSTGR